MPLLQEKVGPDKKAVGDLTRKRRGKRIPSPGGEGRVRGLLIQSQEKQEDSRLGRACEGL